MKECKICGGKLPARRTKYCSESCAMVANKAQQKAWRMTYAPPLDKEQRQKVCEVCGRQYEARQYNQRYCHGCAVEGHRVRCRLYAQKKRVGSARLTLNEARRLLKEYWRSWAK